MRKEQTMSEQPHDTEPVTIVLATRNQGKVRELAEALRAFGLRVVGLDAFPDLPEVEETGTTFEENALLKAREVSKRTGLVAIADDSGIEVDALNGAPGVYSARYSEDMPDLPGTTKDERNTMKLLAALSSVRLWNRSARFRTGPQPQGQGPARASAPLALLLGRVSPEESLTFPRPAVTLGLAKNLLKDYTDAHGKDGFSMGTAPCMGIMPLSDRQENSSWIKPPSWIKSKPGPRSARPSCATATTPMPSMRRCRA